MAPRAVALEPFAVDLSSISEPGFQGVFGKLEMGLKEIDGVPFSFKDARVHVTPGKKVLVEFPERLCGCLHFLHYTENIGDRIGAYSLIYADGQRADLEIRGGFNINDWWKPGQLVFAAQAHSDVLGAPPDQHEIAFWRFSAKNPRPETPVKGIEISNTEIIPVINLIAITLTDDCGDKIGKTPVWENGIDEETMFLAILSQEGVTVGKAKACEGLRKCGTLKSVPVLASCLLDENLAHPARLALASMEYPEARAALREAFASSNGLIKAGLIETLGVLKDKETLQDVIDSLRDKDPAIAMSAALALGRIGDPSAVEALKECAIDGSGRYRMVVLDSLLRCAEAMKGHDDVAAFELYSDIFKQWGRENVGCAAYRGMLQTSGDKACELITSALLSEKSELINAALTIAREPGNAEQTKAYGELVGKVSELVKPDLVEALAQRGDPSAAPYLIPAIADSDAILSCAAIKAVGVLGCGGAVPALVKVAARSDDPNSGIAMQSLTQMNASDVSSSLLSTLQGADAAECAVLAKVMGQRKDDAVAPALRDLVGSSDDKVRGSAVQALAEVGVPEDAELFCSALKKAATDKERASIKRTLIALGARLSTPPEFAKAITANLGSTDVASRCALLGVCGKLRNADLLDALSSAAVDPAVEIKDAAIRSIADSENPDALPRVLGLLDGTSDLTQRVLLLRGVARLASNNDELDQKTREEALLKGLASSERMEEKKLFLGAMGACPTIALLKTVETYLPTNEVVAEAVTAWGQIALQLLSTNQDDVRDAAPGVLARAKEAGVSKEASRSAQDVMRALAATPVSADKVGFEHIVLDKQFRSEGIAIADVNRDGLEDIIAGDLWYEAPSWKTHEIRTPGSYDPNTGYSYCFINFAYDVDDDGWLDSIEFGGPGAPVHWFRNPGAEETHWDEHLLATSAVGETPIFCDLLGDKKPVLIFAYNGRFSWFRTGQDKMAQWLASPFSQQVDLGHGLGAGDLNKDGRLDVISTDGWWEGPSDRSRPDWGFHQVKFGPACANMIVCDVDGDGDNDVISSSAHEYGIWWFEHDNKDGLETFTQHEIDKSISQTHALILADINNDGLQDLVTGKRYYAHCGHDVGCHEPSVLCWYELKRTEPGKFEYVKHEIDSDSGVGTQFEVRDLDADGLSDIVTSNKKGVHVFLQRRSN
jgi:HEAT repeat protein